MKENDLDLISQQGFSPEDEALCRSLLRPNSILRPAQKKYDYDHPDQTCSNCGATPKPLLTCARCMSTHYCDKKCQTEHWHQHKLECDPTTGKGKMAFAGGRNYCWSTPENARKIWTAADMLAAPDQSLDPPEILREEWPNLFDLWYPRPFYIGSELKFEASMLPSCVREAIRKGLRKKQLTWEYLVSENFFLILGHAGLLIDQVVVYIDMMCNLDPKPHASRMLEQFMERWWITQCTMGRPQFNKRMSDILISHDIEMNHISLCGETCDAMRLITHATASKAPPCDCFHCKSRPLLEERKKFIWEAFRLDQQKKGFHIMSYKQYDEINRGCLDEQVWLNGLLAIKAEAEEREEKLNGTYRPAKVPRGEPRLSAAANTLLDTPYPPDDNVQIRDVSPQNLKRIYSILDQAKREKRITTHGELDPIVLLLQAGLRDLNINEKEPAATPAVISPVKPPPSSSSSSTTAEEVTLSMNIFALPCSRPLRR